MKKTGFLFLTTLFLLLNAGVAIANARTIYHPSCTVYLINRDDYYNYFWGTVPEYLINNGYKAIFKDRAFIQRLPEGELYLERRSYRNKSIKGNYYSTTFKLKQVTPPKDSLLYVKTAETNKRNFFSNKFKIKEAIDMALRDLPICEIR